MPVQTGKQHPSSCNNLPKPHKTLPPEPLQEPDPKLLHPHKKPPLHEAYNKRRAPNNLPVHPGDLGPQLELRLEQTKGTPKGLQQILRVPETEGRGNFARGNN